VAELADAALTAPAMGSSIVIARTVRHETAIILFMVVDPSRIATLITQSLADVLVAA
jgi:hypothetical protein